MHRHEIEFLPSSPYSTVFKCLRERIVHRHLHQPWNKPCLLQILHVYYDWIPDSAEQWNPWKYECSMTFNDITQYVNPWFETQSQSTHKRILRHTRFVFKKMIFPEILQTWDSPESCEVSPVFVHALRRCCTYKKYGQDGSYMVPWNS